MQTLYDIAATTRQAFHYWKQPSDCQQEKTPAAVVLRMAKDIRKDFLPGSSAREIFHYIAATTRQAFHYWKQPSDCQQEKTPAAVVLRMAKDIRKDFLPGSSAREIFHYIRTNKHPQYNNLLIGWGKHHFESLCLDAGMRIESRRFVPKTTVRGDYIFPNRIEGADINDINRIWVSDITYLYGVEGQLLGYATSLIDLYSRRLLGLSFSQTMHASVTSRAILEQAFKIRTQSAYPSLIFHSDGGKQYIEKDFLALLRSRNIDSSMAESCYENAFAESFNDLLKNHLWST